MLATHDVVTTDTRKTQQWLGKMVNRCGHVAHAPYLNQLPRAARPPQPDDPPLIGEGGP